MLNKKVKNKISVGILGATGVVGQKFVQLLADHPWFEITCVAASDKSQGKQYAEAMTWRMSSLLPSNIAAMPLQACEPPLPCQLVFSGLSSDVAGDIETKFAQKGYIVISNAQNHRMQSNVPLLIPEINSDHLELVHHQNFDKGMIVTNPNCSVIGLAMALKPLADKWGVDKGFVVTLQSLSGAGYPGVAAYDLIDNVIPFIAGEEEKIETETLKILGILKNGRINNHSMQISAQCNRVGVSEGHIACVSVKLKEKALAQEIIEAWQSFKGEAQALELPNAPNQPLIYHTDSRHPQPQLHRHLGKGMSVSIGHLRKCPLLDWKFNILSHNTIRGAAGGAILNAELMHRKGCFQ